MLKITIELLPANAQSKKKTLCTIDIWNDATSLDESWGNYIWKVKQTAQTGYIKQHSRRGPDAQLLLLRKVLDSIHA